MLQVNKSMQIKIDYIPQRVIEINLSPVNVIKLDDISQILEGQRNNFSNEIDKMIEQSNRIREQNIKRFEEYEKKEEEEKKRKKLMEEEKNKLLKEQYQKRLQSIKDKYKDINDQIMKEDKLLKDMAEKNFTEKKKQLHEKYIKERNEMKANVNKQLNEIKKKKLKHEKKFKEQKKLNDIIDKKDDEILQKELKLMEKQAEMKNENRKKEMEFYIEKAKMKMDINKIQHKCDLLKIENDRLNSNNQMNIEHRNRLNYYDNNFGQRMAYMNNYYYAPNLAVPNNDYFYQQYWQ